MFKPEIIKGGQDNLTAKSKDYKITTLKESSIEEEKIFTKAEILGQIEQLAKQEGFSKNQIEVDEEIYDKDGNLVVMYVKVISGRAKGEGWKSIDYIYSIKGDRGKFGFNAKSSISRIYNLVEPEESEGGIVAKYINGKWETNPGSISPKATEASVIDVSEE